MIPILHSCPVVRRLEAEAAYLRGLRPELRKGALEALRRLNARCELPTSRGLDIGSRVELLTFHHGQKATIVGRTADGDWIIERDDFDGQGHFRDDELQPV